MIQLTDVWFIWMIQAVVEDISWDVSATTSVRLRSYLRSIPSLDQVLAECHQTSADHPGTKIMSSDQLTRLETLAAGDLDIVWLTTCQIQKNNHPCQQLFGPVRRQMPGDAWCLCPRSPSKLLTWSRDTLSPTCKIGSTIHDDAADVKLLSLYKHHLYIHPVINKYNLHT